MTETDSTSGGSSSGQMNDIILIGVLLNSSIVPTVIFSSSEQAKEFLDWLDVSTNQLLYGDESKLSLSQQIQTATEKTNAQQVLVELQREDQLDR